MKDAYTWQVAPDDSHGPVDRLLREVFVDKGCKFFPRHVSTDNVGKDQHTMSDSMHNIRAECIEQGRISASTPPAVIVQDVWHARQRIGVLLNRNHPDYNATVADLRVVFARQDLLMTPWTATACVVDKLQKAQTTTCCHEMSREDQHTALCNSLSCVIAEVRIVYWSCKQMLLLSDLQSMPVADIWQ